MTLGERQELFSEMIAKLITYIYSQGYKVRGGDWKAEIRKPLEHKINSEHYNGCAFDINLFKDKVWLTKTEDHKKFGDYWETLHPFCRWGGRYGDGNHYEVVEVWRNK